MVTKNTQFLLSRILGAPRLLLERLFNRKSLVNKQTFLEKLKFLDLGPIACKLMHPDTGLGWTHDQVNHAITHYLEFLCLIYIYPDCPLVPTHEIDEVWHTHILDTCKYRADCAMLFGKFIDHFPYFGLQGESDRKEWEAAFSETQALFKLHFGTDSLESVNSSLLAVELTGNQSQQLGDGSEGMTKPRACKLYHGSHQTRPNAKLEIAEVSIS